MSRQQYNVAMGQWIFEHRLKLGITQAQVAEAVGVFPSSVVAWEAGIGTMLAYSRDLLGKYFKRESLRRGMTADPMPQPDDSALAPATGTSAVIGGTRG